tara:strand:+ start:805 stop:972 length:168 start_codon:yes stop_codon:yes gene_type:complete
MLIQDRGNFFLNGHKSENLEMLRILPLLRMLVYPIAMPNNAVENSTIVAPEDTSM